MNMRKEKEIVGFFLKKSSIEVKIFNSAFLNLV